MAEWGLSYDELARDHPDLVLASITPFGQTGPWRDYRGSEITLQALGGPLHLNGSAFREPLKSGGFVAQYHCRSEEHTSELQSLMRNTYAVFCLKTKKNS